MIPTPHSTLPRVPVFLRKSGGSIQKFTTDPEHFTREDFIECLCLIPKQPFFLPSGGDNETLCPELKFLEITSRLSFSDEDLHIFILEKERGVSLDVLKLNCLRIIFLRSRRLDIVQHPTGIVKEELDLR